MGLSVFLSKATAKFILSEELVRLHDVAEFDANVAGESDGVAGEGFVALEDFVEVAQLGFAVDGGDHATAFAGDEGEDGHFAHAAGKEAVVVGGCTAALDVAEDGEADLLLDAAGGDEARHEVGTGADAFGDDDDAVVVVAGEALLESADNVVDIEAELGDDGNLGAGGDGGHKGEVP